MLEKKFTDVGIEVFNPKLMERKYYRRRLTDVVSPLFPCYLFVRIDLTRHFRLVKYTRGVRRFVGTENVPTVVPEETVRCIRDRAVDGLITVTAPSFEPGDKVHIKSGPFEGLDAVFEKKLKANDRVSILLTAVNAKVVIDGAALSRG